jgi:hypothetical protein
VSPGTRWLAGRRTDKDEQREQRTASVLQVVERFVYDLGLLISGHDTDLDSYVDTATARRLRDSLLPVVGTELAVRPDFGEYAQVRIEGDLLDATSTVRTVVEFDDRSNRVDQQGRPVSRIRRRVRLLLILDPSTTRIVDHRVDVV